MVKLFLSYAREDRKIVNQIYNELKNAGFSPFMDVRDIFPGENWSNKIQDEIKNSDFFLAILSSYSVKKRGFLQKELHLGLDLWEYMLENDIYLIPIRVEDCVVPEELSKLQWVDLFSQDGYEKLINAIRVGAKRRGLALEQPNQEQNNIITLLPYQDVSVKNIKYPVLFDFIKIPLGEIPIGSDPEKDEYAQVDEQLQFNVFVDSFWISKYLVTNNQYGEFVKDTGYLTPLQWTNGHYSSMKATHPVIGVSWLDSIAFCAWLSLKTGKKFRLPTEFEWEKAARGDDGRIYPWGNKWDKHKLNCLEKEVGDTTDVGKYSSSGDSPYGLCDMVGNVWEWCSSIYQSYPYTQKEDRDQTNIDITRVIRGGSFASSRKETRCACRNRYAQDFRFGLVGFRVAVTIL